MITLVDYGLGNIQAFANIYRRLNIPVSIASTPEELLKAERIILPGVGAFDWAITQLNSSGMRDSLDELVLGQHRPVLGVCVGMQMMAKASDEGELPGIGWLDAEVRHMNDSGLSQGPELPHMGWNSVEPRNDRTLFHGLEDPCFYFLHSYAVVPNDPKDILAEVDYDGPLTAAVHHNNIFGTQFHPEKSHHWGISLLKNFAEI